MNKIIKRIFPNSDFTNHELLLLGLNFLWFGLFFSQVALNV